ARQADLDAAVARLRACGADADLIDLACRCLAAEPHDRPRHAGEVAAALAGYQARVRERLAAPERAPGPPTGRAIAGRERRRPAVGLAVVATALTAVVAGGGWYLQRETDERARERAAAAAEEEARASALREKGEAGLAAGRRALEAGQWGQAEALLAQA